MTTATINGINFVQGVANSDTYGNERIVVHYTNFLTDNERQALDVLKGYAIARKRAKKCGWRPYKGRNFGGGFVQQYCTSYEELANEINRAKGNE